MAYKWNLPVRNRPTQGVLGGNGTNQLSIVFKDLLMDMKASNQDINAFSLTGRLKEVKKFSHLSDELKEILFQESVMFVDRASRTLRENKKEIAMLNKQCQLITANSCERSLSPNEIQNTPTNGHRRSRTQDRFGNRAKIGLGEVGQKRGDESIEPMSKVKDWKSAFELSLTKIKEQNNSITKLSRLCLGALNAIDKIESNIELEKENAKKHVEPNFSEQNIVSTDKNSNPNELNDVKEVIDILKERIQGLENQVKLPQNELDLKNNVKEIIQQEFSQNDKRYVDASEAKRILKEELIKNKTFLELHENLGEYMTL